MADRSCPHRNNDVAIVCQRANRRGHLVDVLDEYRLDASGDAHSASQRAAVSGQERRLAGGIDVGEHQCIDSRKYANEVLEQVTCSRVAMRLERQDHAAPRKTFACRCQRRRHLDRMMTVVVDQRERAAVLERHVTVALKAAVNPFEFGERLHDRGVGNADFASDRNRGERVLHVVNARCGELDRQIRHAYRGRGETHASLYIDDANGAKLCVFGETVGHHRLRDLRQHRADMRIVYA